MLGASCGRWATVDGRGALRHRRPPPRAPRRRPRGRHPVVRSALPVARAVTAHDAAKAPRSRSDRSRSDRAPRSSAGPGRGGVSPRTTACGAPMSTNRWRSSSLEKTLDPPRHRLRAVRRLRVGRAEHLDRRPPPAVDGVLRHRVLLGGAVRERVEQLESLPLVEGLLLADAHHRSRVRSVRAAAERDLVGDRRTVDEPADGAHVGPGERRVVEDARVLLTAVVEQVDQLGARRPERLGRAVEVEAVTGLVLHLGHEDRLAPERWVRG